MMSQARGITGLAATATLAMLAALIAPASAAAPDSSANESTVPVDVQTLVDQLGTTIYPEIYGGYTAPNNGAEMDVFLTSLSPIVETQFKAAAGGTPVVFRSTPNTLGTLQSLTDDLQANWDSIQSDGTNLVEFGPNIDLGKLDIGVEGLTAKDASMFSAMFGAENINVYDVPAADLEGDELDANRNNDTAPYFGGDAIFDKAKNQGGCTSGWGIKIDGKPRLLTAGHCYTEDTNIVNLKQTDSGDFIGSGNDMGVVNLRALPNDIDSEVFTGCNGSGTCGGTGATWTGPLGSPEVTSVSGVGSWAEGDHVCVSGAYGGEVCGLTVEKVDYCRVLDIYHLCDLTKTSGTSLPVSGDSGAPTYRMNSGYARAVGTHTAHNDSTGKEWFTGIHAELNHFGATLITVQ